MATAVLVLNCGSSSVKYALIDPDSGHRHLVGLAERVGSPEVSVKATRGSDSYQVHPQDSSHAGVLTEVLREVSELPGVSVRAVGHRVVHGGEHFAASVLVDEGAVAAIKAVTSLAPLHNPANLTGIEAASAALPGVPQVAVFDTAFHQSMPPSSFRYAVPARWYREHGVRRYGFHGTSHRYVSEKAAELLGRPVEETCLVTAHLGNGCSAAAVKGGLSMDTSMGLTPLEGLVMGTRSGDIDPGVLPYVAEREGSDLSAVLAALNKDSGLLGLSELSNDMRTVSTAARQGSEAASLAIEVFCYRLAKYVAALTVPLGRLDALVFTGGIGENDAWVRSKTMALLGFLGIVEDEAANAEHGRASSGRVSRAGDTLALVVPTDEELVIARDTAALVPDEGRSSR
ncbi:MAG TPA: acetate kinase [Dermatophilaceae bacterium]|nr:acetate kinase [Dermatophilaceae bacterium]